jgi:putative heme-binding domain-containing protein
MVTQLIISAFLSAATLLAADTVAQGRDIYNRSCTNCHGLDGAAGGRAPALAAEREYLRTSEEEIFDAVRNGIPGSLMPAASLSDADIRKVVAYVRSLRAPASESPVAGDVARGEEIFRGKAHCQDCHMLQGKGGLLGPDLSNIGGERNLSAIRDSLTKPRPNTARGYKAARVVTAEGKALSGVVKNENNFSVQFLDSGGKLHLFTRQELRDFKYADSSLMPGDYDQKLRPSEMQDLLSFLSRLARPKEPQ